MEDERYDEMMWERLEDEDRWVGWQGRYTDRHDPYFERLNRLNAMSPEGRRQIRDEDGDWLDFESYNRGPYTHEFEGQVGRRRRAHTSQGWEPSQNLRQPGPYSGVGPRGYQRKDARILEEVCERLALHGRIDAREIEVEVHDGVVTLNGSVPHRKMKRLAEDAIETVPGVRDIQNRLRLLGVKPIVL